MKNILSIMCLFALLAISCSEDELVKKQFAYTPKFTASFEENGSRTYIEERNLLRWTEGDQIALFVGNTLNRQYKFDGETGDNSGTFSIVNNPFGTGNDLTNHYAVYPYAADIKITESGVITVNLPTEQCYAENSFGLGANTMVAVTKDTDDTFLKFKNVGGYLKLLLYGDDVTIKSITLTGNNNEKIAGNAVVTPVYGQNPTISMADEATEAITLNCGEGVKIGSTEKTATAFWLVVSPTTFGSGFTITVTDINGDVFTKSTSNEIVLERNVIKPMEAFKVTMESVELPNGKTFNSTVGTFSLSNIGLKKIKFVANSQNTSGTLLCTDEDGSTAYLVANGEWLEIHTTANNFRANADCSHMFEHDFSGNNSFFYELTEIDYGGCFNTSNVEDMSYMFYYSPSLTSLDVSCFNTENVTNMECMFGDCSALTSLDVSNFNTKNVTNMGYMFRYCSKLTSLDVSRFNTENVTSMYFMFNNCSSLTSLDVSGFKTNNITSMGYMFGDCSALTSLDVSKFETSNAVDMTGMFNNCSSLSLLDVSGFNTANVESMNRMFYYCSALTSLDVSRFDTSKVGSFSYMFCGCSKLKAIDVSKFNTANSKGMESMFSGCTSLTGLDLLSFIFNEYPGVSSMFESVGSTADSCPIPVKVTKDGYIYLTQVTENCKIDPTYAKFVNADGSACDYEEDPRIYNSKTLSVQPEKDANGVYLIQSAANLKWFKENCDKSPYFSAHYKLTTDIISSRIYWDPVWFTGVFDGGNHIIENLVFLGYEDLSYGFFSSMSGTVKNLILKNPQINQSGDNDAYGMHSGLLAGNASGTIINCGIIGGSVSVSSTSKAWANGGGLVGRMTGGTIKGSYVIDTKIKGDHTRNGTYVGGLVGECSSNVTITSCYTRNVQVTGNEGCNIGTFIGHSKASNLSLTTCYYDNSGNAIGGNYSTESDIINGFEALTEVNFTQAITQMNTNLTGCDYIFSQDGSFVKR